LRGHLNATGCACDAGPATTETAARLANMRLHRMRVAGNTLEASCCRTCRRRCAKSRLRRLLAAADHASGLPRTTTPRVDPRLPSTPSPLVMTCFSAQSLGRLFASPAQVGAAQRSDDVIRGPAVGQRIPVDQPVPTSHARPRPSSCRFEGPRRDSSRNADDSKRPT
jgi:hypothetical protein